MILLRLRDCRKIYGGEDLDSALRNKTSATMTTIQHVLNVGSELASKAPMPKLSKGYLDGVLFQIKGG